MRSVSYVQRVSLDFTGTIFPHAICLGDADNDLLNELVVGDTSGKLYIYKNDDCKPWITRTCVGMLTCVGVGDVCNKGRVRLSFSLFFPLQGKGWWYHGIMMVLADKTIVLISEHCIHVVTTDFYFETIKPEQIMCICLYWMGSVAQI
uniref:Integrin alpha FG-GAP repeat containing 2 n=1 Tax=Sinocyclocheilus rhinocerous TaxID=307959 RepID=A0A673IKR6_9TELE